MIDNRENCTVNELLNQSVTRITFPAWNGKEWVNINEITFEDVLRARESGDKKLINETSLGLIYQHYLKSETKSFSILTAWRLKEPKATNLQNQTSLQNDIRALGLGYGKLQGHWRECQDDTIPYDKCPKDQLKDTIEPSFYVPGLNIDNLLRLLKKYNQDAGIYLGPETNGKAAEIYKNGQTRIIGDFHPDKINQAYFKIRQGSAGRTFVFEYFSYPAQSWGEALIEQNYHKLAINPVPFDQFMNEEDLEATFSSKKDVVSSPMLNKSNLEPTPKTPYSKKKDSEGSFLRPYYPAPGDNPQTGQSSSTSGGSAPAAPAGKRKEEDKDDSFDNEWSKKLARMKARRKDSKETEAEIEAKTKAALDDLRAEDDEIGEAKTNTRLDSKLKSAIMKDLNGSKKATTL
jgi:hypothetical protein